MSSVNFLVWLHILFAHRFSLSLIFLQLLCLGTLFFFFILAYHQSLRHYFHSTYTENIIRSSSRVLFMHASYNTRLPVNNICDETMMFSGITVVISYFLEYQRLLQMNARFVYISGKLLLVDIKCQSSKKTPGAGCGAWSLF